MSPTTPFAKQVGELFGGHGLIGAGFGAQVSDTGSRYRVQIQGSRSRSRSKDPGSKVHGQAPGSGSRVRIQGQAPESGPRVRTRVRLQDPESGSRTQSQAPGRAGWTRTGRMDQDGQDGPGLGHTTLGTSHHAALPYTTLPLRAPETDSVVGLSKRSSIG